MACAAVDDVTAWCLLAVVVAVSSAGSPMDALVSAGEAVGFFVVMVAVVRPLLARWAPHVARFGASTVLVLLFSGLCLCGLATDRIGVHAMFGAFVFGAVMPRRARGAVRTRAIRNARASRVLLLLPLFFVVTGLNTRRPLLGGDGRWLALADLLVASWASSAGRRRGGTGYAGAALARGHADRGVDEHPRPDRAGHPQRRPRSSACIDAELFTMLVLMALITTAMTSPALTALLDKRPAPREAPVPRQRTLA